ncbi:unnamed protein product, partial [Trichogramma brassicae]
MASGQGTGTLDNPDKKDEFESPLLSEDDDLTEREVTLKRRLRLAEEQLALLQHKLSLICKLKPLPERSSRRGSRATGHQKQLLQTKACNLTVSFLLVCASFLVLKNQDYSLSSPVQRPPRALAQGKMLSKLGISCIPHTRRGGWRNLKTVSTSRLKPAVGTFYDAAKSR